MSADHLYSDHWLLSYEAFVKGWLPPTGGTNYITQDPFFEVLNSHGVSFYNDSSDLSEGYSPYDDIELDPELLNSIPSQEPRGGAEDVTL